MTHTDNLTLARTITRLQASGVLETSSPSVDLGTLELTSRPAITADSRAVTPGALFVAVRGARADGHDYLGQAASAGAVAAVVERPDMTAPIPLIRVSDSRKAYGELASLAHGDPSGELAIAAITGTNGKTTTAWLLAQALTHSGHKSGFIGTIGYGSPDDLAPATHTTPDAWKLQAQLADLVAGGFKACAMEVSSHALDQDRVAGMAFRTAIFTNLTRDHLDYHGTEAAYLASKAKLFEALDPEALAVINADDPSAGHVTAASRGRVLTFGTRTGCDVVYAIRSDQSTGLKLRLDGVDAQFPLSGSFNAANIAAAYTAMAAYDLEPRVRIEALQSAGPAPGRFELLRLRRDRVAIVDYAHTPDALRNVLEAARRIVPAGANLWCVFGCGGDRDKGKRPMMGAIAEAQADRVVVTSDNPRTEDPEAIMRDVREGMRRPGEAHWVTDRAAAIRRAVQSAGLGDVIVVAGKGHESYQVVGTETHPFSDLAELKAASGT